MQRSDIGTATRAYLGQIGVNYITGTILYAGINRAARKLNREAGLNRGDVTMTLAPGKREKTMQGTILEVYRVRLGTGLERVTLDVTDTSAKDRDADDWESGTAGDPVEYWTDGMVMGFEPKPFTWTIWDTATRYATSAYIIPTTDNGFYYKCQTAGTSYTTAPTWPVTEGSHVTETASGPSWSRENSTRVYIRCNRSVASMSTATSSPTWCPSDYHETIAKGAAWDIASGIDAENVSPARLQRLYEEYLREKNEVKALAEGRSRHINKYLKPTGYESFAK